MEWEPQRRSIPVPPQSSRSWQMAKATLHCASVACCGVVLGLSAARTWEGSTGTGILTIPVTAAAAAWTIAELLALCIRRKSAPGRGIHPGAHVGVQLVLFLALILSIFYSAMLWRSVQHSLRKCNEWERDPRNPDWVIQNSTSVNSDGRHPIRAFFCPEDYRQEINDPAYRSSVQAIIAFCAMLWFIHFTLFVRACVETRRLNSEPQVMWVYPRAAWPAPYEERYVQDDAQERSGSIPMKETHYG
ncbi:hypothetical protein M426DRAFT_20943 [Hypoxylon sp. CI-4A]|nr:hypothetical protein M426DRAFT_20943 [Hypoxylon sp. CI-4A]